MDKHRTMCLRVTYPPLDHAGLQRALWWMVSKHFGFRGRDESRKLKWGDIKLAQDPETKNEVLIWVTNRGTKTESGEKEIASVRTFNPHIQATGDRGVSKPKTSKAKT